MDNRSALHPGGTPGGPALAGLRDRALLRLAALATRSVVRGRLTLTLPSGHSTTIGPGGGAEAHIALASFQLVAAAIRRGSLGFAESYVDGTVHTPDLAEVFRFFIDNRQSLDRSGRGLFRVRAADRRVHAGNSNTRGGSRRNIAAHYDLGNGFYRLWLDSGLTYSSAVFTDDSQSLADAQTAKYDRVLAALGSRPGDRVLEIGCGWGGFAEHAARHGLDVTAITVSAEQHRHAEARLRDAGLAGRTEVRFQDYRDVAGSFDRIASIEMIEAVGEEHWSDYFRVLHDRLTPGGTAVIQAITIREASWGHYRGGTDFIQRYIFPGGMLPTRTHLAEHATRAGLTYEVVETFGASYARTLELWREAFLAERRRILALGHDERFLRLWDYYLCYCRAGFERGVVDVGHYRFTRPATTVT